jgi:hypothetical protein
MLPLLPTMRLCSWPWASTRRNRTSRWFWPWTRLTITPMADPQPHVATMSGTCWAGKLLCHFHIKFCIYHCLLLNLRCNGIFAVQELSPFGGGGWRYDDPELSGHAVWTGRAREGLRQDSYAGSKNLGHKWLALRR